MEIRNYDIEVMHGASVCGVNSIRVETNDSTVMDQIKSVIAAAVDATNELLDQAEQFFGLIVTFTFNGDVTNIVTALTDAGYKTYEED